MGNSFIDDSKDLFTLDTKTVMADSAAQELCTVQETARTKQYQAFTDDKLKDSRKYLNDAIVQNKFKIFRLPPSRVMKKSEAQLSSLTGDCSLFSRLNVSYQIRAGDTEKLLS